VTTLARRVRDLEVQLRELRASKRAAHTTVTSGRLIAQGRDGHTIEIDATDRNPSISWNDPQNNELGVINAVTGDRPELIMSTGPIALDDDGGNLVRWYTWIGQDSDGYDAWEAGCAPDSGPGDDIGGHVYLDRSTGQLIYLDPVDGTQSTTVQCAPTYVTTYGNLVVIPLLTTAPAQEWQNGSGTVTAQMSPTGDLTLTGGLTATGVNTSTLVAGDFASGTVTITPSAPNTPTSATIGGFNLHGSVFRGQATAATSVPGTTVTGVGITGASATGATVWITRTNTTATVVNWEVRGTST
jgi:hypothetical protein